MNNEKLKIENNRLVIESIDSDDFQSYEVLSDECYDLFNTLYAYEVEFSEDLTIEGFMRSIQPFIDQIQYHFQSHIGNCDLKQFFDLLNINPTKEPNNDIDYIEMFWNCEIWEMEDIMTGTTSSEFSKWGGYHGCSKKDKINYCFGLNPINEWKHHNFKLNDSFVCYRHSEILTQEILFKSTLQWTFGDLLKHFFYELTYYGSIEDIEKFNNELIQRVDEINNSEIGNEKFFSIDDLRIETLEKQLEEAVKTENYEAATRIQSKIQKIKEDQKK